MEDILDSGPGQFIIKGMAILTIIIGVVLMVAVIAATPAMVAYGISVSMPFWTIVGYTLLTAFVSSCAAPIVGAMIALPANVLEN